MAAGYFPHGASCLRSGLGPHSSTQGRKNQKGVGEGCQYAKGKTARIFADTHGGLASLASFKSPLTRACKGVAHWKYWGKVYWR
jgi:hypothetical protein